MSRSIYLVIGAECESSGVFGAFEAKRDAAALVKACLAYQSTPRPEAPEEIDDTPKNAAAWDAYYKRVRRWDNRHPGGREAHGYDRWFLQRIRLQAPCPAEQKDSPAALGSDGKE